MLRNPGVRASVRMAYFTCWIIRDLGSRIEGWMRLASDERTNCDSLRPWFVLVCLGVMIMRRLQPTLHPAFPDTTRALNTRPRNYCLQRDDCFSRPPFATNSVVLDGRWTGCVFLVRQSAQ